MRSKDVAYSGGNKINGGGCNDILVGRLGNDTLISLCNGNTILVMNIVPTDNNFLGHIVW